MTAGRCFEVAMLVKGNGTRTTSPNSKGIVGVVFRVVPDGGEGGGAGGGGGADKRAVLLTRGDEIHEILDFGDALDRQRLDFPQQGLSIGHGVMSFLSRRPG